MIFKTSEIYILFPKSCSVNTPGGRHHMETFMKLLIDFFHIGKRFCTQFPVLFSIQTIMQKKP